MKILQLLFMGTVLMMLVSCNNGSGKVDIHAEHKATLEQPKKSYINLDSLYDKVKILKTRGQEGMNLYAVMDNDKWGVIDVYGGSYIAPEYDAYASNKNSIALKKDGVWNVLDNTYNKIDSGKMDSLVGYHDNLYISIHKGKKALVHEKSVTDHIYTEIIGPSDDAGYFYGQVNDHWNVYDFSGLSIKKRSVIQQAALKALNEYRLTLYGYGPIRLGMSIVEVEKAVGLDFIENGSSSDCVMMQFDTGFPSIRFLFDKKDNVRLLERIYIGEVGIKTKSGVGINSSEKDMLEAYGSKMEKMPHKYNDKCVYYYYVPVDKEDKDFRLNFDYNFEEDRVRHYSVGRVPAISYVEGCF